MALISLAEAKLHLRVDGSDEDTTLAIYIAAAEASTVQFIQRKIFATSGDLTTAIAAAPAALSSATTTYTAAVAAAQALTDSTEQTLALSAAEYAYSVAQEAYRWTMAGVVVDDTLKAAILLHLGTLYENREAVVAGSYVAVELPLGLKHLLAPYRVYA